MVAFWVYPVRRVRRAEHLLMEDTVLQFSCYIGYICFPVAMTDVRIPQGAPELSAARQFLQYKGSRYEGDGCWDVFTDGGDHKMWHQFVSASLGHILEEMRQPIENQAEIDDASLITAMRADCARIRQQLGRILEEMRQPVENQAEIDAASVRLLRESGNG
jgi:hypothetical protein